MDSSINKAFLISQIGKSGSDIRKRADEVYKYIVAPVTEEAGLDLMRSDLDPTPGQVTSQILRSILNSKVIIADLTGRNPNVYYELGVVHSFGVPVVILVDNSQSLSFDTQNERVIEIGDEGTISASQADEAKKNLGQVLNTVLDEEYKPSSLITEVARTQSLIDLAPENAIASEFTSIKQRLDEIHSYVRRSVKPERSAEIRVLTDFVSALAEGGRLKENDLERLFDFETPLSFDGWVNSLRGTVADKPRQDIDINEEDFDDIPF